MLRLLALLLALLAAPALAAPAPSEPRAEPRAEPRPEPRLVIVDDDFIGLNGAATLLLQAPDVRVLGLTTTSGSVWRDTATAYALRTLEILHRTDVPVVPGRELPLLNTAEATKRWEGLYGRLVFKGPWTDYWPGDTLQQHPGASDPRVVPPLAIGMPSTKPSGEGAAQFLVRMVRAHPGRITLIATGPMTNIALATLIDPTFAENVKELVTMGGSLAPHQVLAGPSADQFAREFVNSPRREFNVRWDPEAARIVAHAAFPKVTMVPVDPSTGTQWSDAFLARLAPARTPLTTLMQTAMQRGFPMWDEISAMAWLHPEVVAREQTLWIDYETSQTAAYGDTLSWSDDWRPHLGERPQRVILAIDRAKLEEAMAALYTRPLPR